MILPELLRTHPVSSDPGGQAGLGLLSTGMGDPLGKPGGTVSKGKQRKTIAFSFLVQMDGLLLNPTTLSFHLSGTPWRWIKGVLGSCLTLGSFLPIIFIISGYGEPKATVQTLDTSKTDLSGVKTFSCSPGWGHLPATRNLRV